MLAGLVRNVVRVEREVPSAAEVAALCWAPMIAMTSWETFSGKRTLKLGYGGWKSGLGNAAGRVRGHLR